MRHAQLNTPNKWIVLALFWVAIIAGCGKSLDMVPLDVRPEDGKPYPVWMLKTKGPVVTDPIIYKDILVAACLDRQVYKIDLAASEFRWSEKFKTTPSHLATFDDSLIYVSTTPPDGYIYAISHTKHKEVWKRRVGGVHSSPAQLDDLIFFGSDAKRLFALNRWTGKTDWEYRGSDFVRTHPVVQDSMIVVATDDGQVLALNRFNGNEMWTYEHTAAIAINPAVVGERIYFIAEDEQVLCLNILNGTRIWQQAIPGCNSTPPVPLDDGLLIHSLTGKCYLLSQQDGETRWVIDSPMLIVPPLVYGPYLILIGQQDGLIQMIDYADDSVYWEHKLDERVRTQPLLWNDLLIFGTIDKKIYAYQLPAY